MKKYQLMAPGPTPVPSEVLLAMARPMIHHRTPEYAALFDALRAGTDATVIVDAVSSLGIADVPMDAWAIDVLVSASQKGLMLPPGLGIVALSDKAWSMAARSSSPKFYLDLVEERKYASKNEARFTPGVAIMAGLREVLRM